MSSDIRIALYGDGQVSTNVAAILLAREGVVVSGPHGRDSRDRALSMGHDVVVIATTSFLREIAPDVEAAVKAGSNVITTAEEAASPWANDAATADRLDALARAHGVSILGTGLNPGFAFDALVLTVCGATARVDALRVTRVVDLSGFGETVLRRIGVGHTADEFEAGKRAGTVTGHIGFPQSMQVVAGRLGVKVERIDGHVDPIFAESRLEATSLSVAAGETAGFRQRYQAVVGGEVWFEALFTGHIAPHEIGLEPRDEIVVEGAPPLHVFASPGFNPQSGSAAVVANSIRRVIAARPGWRTVGELPPAIPR